MAKMIWYVIAERSANIQGVYICNGEPYATLLSFNFQHDTIANARSNVKLVKSGLCVVFFFSFHSSTGEH